MNFTDIRSSVGEAWEFSWPPVVLLCLMLAIAWTVAPGAVNILYRKLSPHVCFERLRRVAAALRWLGLKTLAPVLTLFLLVFLFFVTSQGVYSIGGTLPPSISYRPDVLVARFGEERLVGCLTAMYAGRASASEDRDRGAEIVGIIQRRIESETREDSNVKYWQQRLGIASGRFDATKFMSMWVLISWVAQRFFGGKRTNAAVGWLLVLALTGAYFLVGYLYAIEQHNFAQLHSAETRLLATAECQEYQVPSDQQDSEVTRRRLGTMSGIERLKEEQWWSFGVGSISSYTSWVLENVIRDRGR